LRALPGVAGVTAVHCPPTAGDCGDWFYSVVGLPAPPRDQTPISLFNSADAGYFHMMRIPLREGREFNDTDRGAGPQLAIINERLAHSWWPNESAVGHQIKVGGPYYEGGLLEIVGVAADVRQSALDVEPMQEIYLAASQQHQGSMTIVLRTAGDSSKLMTAVRTRVAALDPNLPLEHVGSLTEQLGAGLARRRFSTMLLTLFAGLAMLLAAVGIYGLLSYWVTSREPEIAIRLALGANPSRILRWTSMRALRLAALGVVLGAGGAWLSARLLRDMVYTIDTHDFATICGAALAVIAIALAATALPSWRAARVDAAQRLHQG
jgi:putative ABC transport system permease protein